ncbi:MAG: hypothetical protein AAFU56_00880 [Pseudomonadota bacterium]
MKTLLSTLSVLVVVLSTSSAMASSGACFYDADGKLKGRDSCRADKVVTPCAKDNAKAMCTVGNKGACQKAGGDYSKFIVVDRSESFNCPKRF